MNMTKRLPSQNHVCLVTCVSRLSPKQSFKSFSTRFMISKNGLQLVSGAHKNSNRITLKGRLNRAMKRQNPFILYTFLIKNN